MDSKPEIDILIAAPRGFCAGVKRAISIVELALEKYGPPIYVRHQIVHNKYVVDGLRDKGAVFVRNLDEVPDGAHVIFSAHGVAKKVPATATERGLNWLDATCPLVSKVHRQAERMVAQGRHILFIGHAGHPEVIGTFGQVPEGAMTLVETLADAETINPPAGELGFLTQTTLSVDDTAAIITRLRQRFPAIQGPRGEDICYATTNRQGAVKSIARRCQLLLVIGAENSSNSQRLKETARKQGTPAYLIQRASSIDWQWFDGVDTVGITAGASAPEVLVLEVVKAISDRYRAMVEEVEDVAEDVTFKLPRELVD